ncbi:MAG: sulfatase [Planctomycetaceae bacterium]
MKTAKNLTWIAVTALLIADAAAEAAQQPNVVLFVVDDMGWMDSSAYGSQYYETPNMDRLAKQSMRFTDAYAVPLCSPTRCSILSGQYSSRHGVTSASGHQPPAAADASRYAQKASPASQFVYASSKNFIDPKIVTLAEVLRDAGYRTGHFGKWHLGLMPEHRPDRNGFETTWACAPDPGPPSYFSPYGVSIDGRPTGKHHVGNISDGPDGEYITDRLTDEALKFVEAHRDEPFFLNLWQYGVHGPWGHKEEYTAEFAKKTDPRGQQRNPIMASMLKSVDESLGRVMDRLDELGLSQNTLLIFYSDNGGNVHSNREDDHRIASLKEDHPRMASIRNWRKWAGTEGPTNNAPLREGKARIYEGGQRVPLMIRWPGKIPPGSISDAVVGAIDLYPTVLDALNIKRPANHIIDGQSLLPVLQQSGRLNREAYFTWFPHIIPAVSVRKAEWKLIRRFEPHRDYPEVRELYNLNTDIGETNNMASALPDKVMELDALIDGFIKDTNALVPRPNLAYQPRAARAARAPDAGLVPRMCTMNVNNGALVVTLEPGKRNPFLGTAQVKADKPLTLHLRIRSQTGGAGKVQWKHADQDDFPVQEQTVPFSLPPATDWQTITINLPINSRTQILRLYLPLENGPLEIQSINYVETQSKKSVKQWEFE